MNHFQRPPNWGYRKKGENLCERGERHTLPPHQYDKHILKFSKMENIAITFTEREALMILHPHYDTLAAYL